MHLNTRCKIQFRSTISSELEHHARNTCSPYWDASHLNVGKQVVIVPSCFALHWQCFLLPHKHNMYWLFFDPARTCIHSSHMVVVSLLRGLIEPLEPLEPFSSQTPQTPTWVQAFYSTNIELIRALPCCTSMNHKATDQIDMWHTGRNVQHAGTQMMYISHRDTWNHQMNLIHWCSACCGGFLTEVKHKWMVSVLPPAAVHVIVHGSSINTWCQCKVVWGQINPFC